MIEGESELIAYCDCCRLNIPVHGAMGDWMRFCIRCNYSCFVCTRGEWDDIGSKVPNYCTHAEVEPPAPVGDLGREA